MAEDKILQKYAGSRALRAYLPVNSVLRIDQVNYIFGILATFVAALFMRTVFTPHRCGPSVRHAFAGSLGLLLALFMYGHDAFHLLVHMCSCYILMTLGPARTQHIMVFIFAMTYLSFVNIKQMMTDYGGVVVNVTGPVMILTQRMILLAFSIYDGSARNDDNLTDSEKSHMVSKLPSPLEMFSYTFYFPAVTSGPLFFYKDYEDFIMKGPPKEKSCKKAVAQKLVNAIIALFLNLMGTKKYAPKTLVDHDFIQESTITDKIIGCITGLHLTKSKFYFAWSISDAACNVSGFGYNKQKYFTQSRLKVNNTINTDNQKNFSTINKNQMYNDSDSSRNSRTYQLDTYQRIEDENLFKMDSSERHKEKIQQTDISKNNQKSPLTFNYNISTNIEDEWDLISNIKPSGIETALNFRSSTNNWNIQNHNWVKYICYDRASPSMRLSLSYVLVALWHGFYPGYWITFVQAVFLTETSRLGRRLIRPVFLQPNENNKTPNPKMTAKKRFYDLLTWFLNYLTVCYNMAPFYLLEFQKSITFYHSVYWCGHIGVGGAYVLLKFIDSMRRLSQKKT